MQFFPKHWLLRTMSDDSPLSNPSATTYQSVLGEIIMADSQQKEDKKQHLIAQLIAENQQLKQELNAKKLEIQQLKLQQQNDSSLEFKKILQGVADALVIVDTIGNVQFVNPAAEKLFGRPAHDLLNHYLGLPVSRDPTEINIFQANGQLIVAEMRVAEIFWNNETAYLAALRDVTERKKLEETLLQISTAVKSSSEAISILDIQGKSLYHNPAFVELFGYTSDVVNEIGGLTKVFCRQDAERYQTIIEKLTQGENSWQGELTISPPNRKKCQLSLHADTIFDGDKQLIGIVITATDITEQKRVEKQLHQTNRKLKASVQQLAAINQDLLLLGETIELLQNCVSSEESIQILQRQIPRLFKGMSGGLFRLTQKNNLMEVITTWGAYQNSVVVFAQQDCHTLKQDPGFPLTTHPHDKQLSLCFPLKARGETLGLIYLCSPNKRPLPDEKRQFAATVADHLALALVNLKLRERLQQECIRDPLTGLFNRRYLEASLEREIGRSQRTKHPLGIIMVDVDHFKRFNDDYGHEAGDAVLRTIGEFLQKSIRSSDIACRYGGEELTLIFPDANLKQTKYRAEQLRQGIQQLVIDYKGKPLPKITASFGVVSYPQQGTTASQLLNHADTALYQAKQQGRDRVVVAVTQPQ